jgi:hypothetical protein
MQFEDHAVIVHRNTQKKYVTKLSNKRGLLVHEVYYLERFHPWHVSLAQVGTCDTKPTSPWMYFTFAGEPVRVLSGVKQHIICEYPSQ